MLKIHKTSFLLNCKNIIFKHQQLPYMTHLIHKLFVSSLACLLEVAISITHVRSKATNVSRKPTEQCFSNFREQCQKHLSEPQVPGIVLGHRGKFWVFFFYFIMKTAHFQGDSQLKSLSSRHVGLGSEELNVNINSAKINKEYAGTDSCIAFLIVQGFKSHCTSKI